MRVFTGTLSDGKSAAVAPVRVILKEDGLRIVHMDDAREEFWPEAVLVTSGPLLKGHDTLLSHRDRPGSRLHVPDPALSGLLLRQIPRLGSRAHHRRILLPLFGTAVLVVTLSAFLLFSDFSLSRVVAGMIPEKARIAMGDMLARSLAGKGGFCDNPPGIRALEHIVKRLAGSVPGDARPYRVRVARMDIINAFTVPGRQIVISDRLVAMADSAEELAGVIAHEMGHAMEIHPETSLVRSLGISTAIMLLAGGSSDVLTETAALLLQMSYSRKAEREADDHALRLLRNSGISAEPLARFFEKLEKEVGRDDGSQLAELFSTHPLTKDRIAHIRHAGTWQTHPLLDPVRWQALRHICDPVDSL